MGNMNLQSGTDNGKVFGVAPLVSMGVSAVAVAMEVQYTAKLSSSVELSSTAVLSFAAVWSAVGVRFPTTRSDHDEWHGSWGRL